MNKPSAVLVLGAVLAWGIALWASNGSEVTAVLGMISYGLIMIGGYMMGYYLEKIRHG